MNQKLLLFGVITLILVGVGSYILGIKKSQPTQINTSNSISISPTAVQPNDASSETANWKIYINTKYKFSFKYPSNLFIRSDSRDEFIGFLEEPNENSSQRIVVSVNKNLQNIEIQEFAMNNSPIPDDRINVQYERKKVNNYPALVVRYEHPCLGACPNEKNYKSLLISVQGDGFIVSFSHEKGDEALMNQILSTFQFSN